MCCSTDRNSGNVIDYFIQSANKKLNLKRITLIADAMLTNSPTQNLFKQRIVSEFPSSIVNTTELLDTLPTISSSTNLKKMLSKTSDGDNLNVILITNVETTSTMDKLIKYIKTIFQFMSSRKPPKFLIFLFNLKESIKLDNFLKICWKRFILDITIVELVQEVTIDKFYHSVITRHVIIHQYNPFENIYKKEFFSPQLDIFPDKLKNLHGYRLNAGIVAETHYRHRKSISMFLPSNARMLPRNSMAPELTNLHPFPILLTTCSLSKALNFTINMKIRNSIKDLEVGLRNVGIDFTIQPLFPRYISTYYQQAFYPYFTSIHLIVRQHPQYKTNFTEESIIIAGVYCLILLIMSLTVLLMKFNRRKWSIYNIIQILIGNSVAVDFERIGERILYLCLIYVYIIFSTDILGSLVDINFHKLFLIDFKTFEDAEMAGVIPCLAETDIISGTAFHPSSSLKKLIHRNYKCNAPDCWSNLFRNEKRFNACSTNQFFAEALHSVFSKPSLGLVISIVEESIISSTTTIAFPGSSPYADVFQIKLYRIYEAGLINIWLEKEKDYFKTEIRRFYKDKVKEKIIIDTKASSNFYGSILVLFGCALAVSTLQFLGEILWHYLCEKIENYIYNLFLF